MSGEHNGDLIAFWKLFPTSSLANFLQTASRSSIITSIKRKKWFIEKLSECPILPNLGFWRLSLDKRSLQNWLKRGRLSRKEFAVDVKNLFVLEVKNAIFWAMEYFTSYDLLRKRRKTVAVDCLCIIDLKKCSSKSHFG